MFEWSILFLLLAFIAGLSGFCPPVRESPKLTKWIAIGYAVLFMLGLLLVVLGGVSAA